MSPRWSADIILLALSESQAIPAIAATVARLLGIFWNEKSHIPDKLQILCYGDMSEMEISHIQLSPTGEMYILYLPLEWLSSIIMIRQKTGFLVFFPHPIKFHILLHVCDMPESDSDRSNCSYAKTASKQRSILFPAPRKIHVVDVFGRCMKNFDSKRNRKSAEQEK